MHTTRVIDDARQSICRVYVLRRVQESFVRRAYT